MFEHCQRVNVALVQCAQYFAILALIYLVFFLIGPGFSSASILKGLFLENAAEHNVSHRDQWGLEYSCDTDLV